jgi:hypothetical protein
MPWLLMKPGRYTDLALSKYFTLDMGHLLPGSHLHFPSLGFPAFAVRSA